MIKGNAVVDDLRNFRQELLAQGTPYKPLLKLKLWRPLFDIAFDWATIALAVAAVCLIGWWLAPVAVLLVGNRQRALGNILHDAAHQNLHRNRALNDAIAGTLVAPLILTDLASYRRDHLQHHLMLGDADKDPDHMPAPSNRTVSWLANYARNVLSARAWLGSMTGSMGVQGVAFGAKLYIAAWWVLGMWALAGVAGWPVASTFLAIWWVARGTAFHAITVFREMCDHFGLCAGSIVSFTRDVTRGGVWRKLVHPRNNGYHLTHHLLPAVPYYHLPDAQRLFAQVPMYRNQGPVFTSYVLGTHPVVSGWRTGI